MTMVRPQPRTRRDGPSRRLLPILTIRDWLSFADCANSDGKRLCY